MNTGRDQFKRFKKIINLISSIFSIFGKKGNRILFSTFRNKGGKSGLVLRYIFLNNLVKSMGDNVAIHPNVFLLNTQNLELGSNISIHPMCYIDSAGGIRIGSNVSIAHSTSILSTNHTWLETDTPIKYNKEEFKKTVLLDDVWIGCGVRILAGVVIKSRSVIAAGAVVNKDVESRTLVGGIPAKVLKDII